MEPVALIQILVSQSGTVHKKNYSVQRGRWVESVGINGVQHLVAILC